MYTSRKKVDVLLFPPLFISGAGITDHFEGSWAPIPCLLPLELYPGLWLRALHLTARQMNRLRTWWKSDLHLISKSRTALSL